MGRGKVSLNFIRALIVLVVASCPLFVWLVWILSTELVHSIIRRDWVWTAAWTGVAVIMVCGIGQVILEGWWLWKDSRHQG
ncbi:hypothetical protein E7T06_07630 [Deinococcus sp. Arct2-2]|uniref:hypothetical protein n=1 Tax=Deinococcus sp. Arct2-2 TaxID=2568653 RepID=UPI0010A5776F|nr:hypothetical protein [Deinococcus sp. Arct2-2]THF70334.1 hypothetical protein E7T06_07630 [Deinococcus sp. Arct2-2]